MKFKVIMVSFVIASLISGNPVFCKEIKTQKVLKKGVLSAEISENKIKDKLKTIWIITKGEPADNSLLMGMYSYHTAHRWKNYNEQNNMLALQIKGISIGTFDNSYDNQTYFASFARKLHTWELPKNFELDFQYKAGIMHGYDDKYPNIAGITPIILPIIGLNYKGYGADLFIIPSQRPILSVNFKTPLPSFEKIKKWKKSKPSNI
ncbi:MAG: hypothetical protein PHV68_02715 [Candidatus Gastranaerophilales bacterium]|nr:hypothetical protein [Candidatus Gastranaerophilales bacterium]